MDSQMLTMNDLYGNKDILINIINKSYRPVIVKTCSIVEKPNPWGWSALADIRVALDNDTILQGQVLHYYSASSFDLRTTNILLDWVRSIKAKSEDNIFPKSKRSKPN